MKVGIAIALVCIAFGVLWRLKPDYMKYGWWGKDPVHRKLVTEEAHLSYMRKSGAILMIFGCVVLLACLILYIIHKK